MNIKFFAPGSKEFYCPALPKSQGYSRNKQSCPSPGGMCTHRHTRTQWQREKEVWGWARRSSFHAPASLAWGASLRCLRPDSAHSPSQAQEGRSTGGPAPSASPHFSPLPSSRRHWYSQQKQRKFDAPKAELPGEGAVGTSCEWDQGSWVCGLQPAGTQPAVKQRPGLGPITSGRGRGHAILTLVHRLQCSVPEGGTLGTRNLFSNQYLQCRLIQAVADCRQAERGWVRQ